MDAVGNDERSISITWEIVTSPSLILCIAAPPAAVRGRRLPRGWGPASRGAPQNIRSRTAGLERRLLRHGRPESPLPLDEMRFSLPDQHVSFIPELVALFDQALRRLPYFLRSDSDVGR